MIVYEVNLFVLLGWVIALLFMIGFRYRMLGVYRLKFDIQEGSRRKTFIRRYQWSWVAIAFLWASVVPMSYGRSGVGVQFICGMLVMGQGLISLVSFSPYLPVFRVYANTVVLVVSAAPQRRGTGRASVAPERHFAFAPTDRGRPRRLILH